MRFNEARTYNNDNIHIRLFDYTVEGIKAQRYSAFEALMWALEAVDTTFIGEEYCLSNYEMGCTLYNCNRDKVYILNFSELDRLSEGKTIILTARTPDETDREIIAREEM